MPDDEDYTQAVEMLDGLRRSKKKFVDIAETLSIQMSRVVMDLRDIDQMIPVAEELVRQLQPPTQPPSAP